MREAMVEARLVIGVYDRGGVAEKVKALGERGFFDRLVVMPGGRVYFVELKRPKGGRVSVHQKERIARYRGLGASVHLIKSLAEVDAFLAIVDSDSG